MFRTISRILALGFTLISFSVVAADYKYATTITAAMPAGAAGAVLGSNLPKGAKFSPCNSATDLDQIVFTLKYDAGKLATEKKDLYFIFYRPDAVGLSILDSDPKYVMVVKRFPGPALQLIARADIDDLNQGRETDMYVPAANNLGGAQTDIILGGNISMDGLYAGLWVALSIIGDKATIDFDDPATWLAWDAVPFMLRKPWQGKTNTTCL